MGLGAKNLTGEKHGRLTVKSYSHSDKRNRSYWKCVCDCGEEVTRRGDGLTNDSTIRSCGCYRNEISKKYFTENNPNSVHGLYKTRIYKIYHKMKERCYNPNYSQYYLYGGRGIDISEDWLSDFMNFYNWSNLNGYSEELSIDRKDNEKGYSSENCKWSNVIEQANNKRNNVYLTHDGETHTLAQWARKMNEPVSLLSNRWKDRLPVDEILAPRKR